ncbi:putative holin [Pantoea eucrina]|uniref:putative holin n=1 Tax=Pantoea eucrina TaxID=472693 RepID=UPI00080F39B7|nr:putative holin [Pantoea eucrina]
MYTPTQVPDVNAATATAAAAATPVTLVAFFHSIPPDVLIGAFAGAVMFLLSSASMSRIKLLGYFFISIVAGILAAEGVANILTAVLSLFMLQVKVSTSVGALFAAASAINIILVVKARAVERVAGQSGDNP